MFKHLFPTFIYLFLFSRIMNSTINLNYQLGSFTVKISDEPFNYLLTTEFDAEFFSSKAVPQLLLRNSHGKAQRTCLVKLAA